MDGPSGARLQQLEWGAPAQAPRRGQHATQNQPCDQESIREQPDRVPGESAGYHIRQRSPERHAKPHPDEEALHYHPECLPSDPPDDLLTTRTDRAPARDLSRERSHPESGERYDAEG